ncbi:LOW QUALITY PROTEIN: translationally-controlled tumor protein homolog [Liolophura sinensis]|uniref:LOW QUALITY PROTEIN: translationally-controlled tumor protein homolog n=1 Tax=Liolophura sinensis TaxID=3198878 RepID=UPI0031591F21
MIIFKDIASGDEMFTDAYKMEIMDQFYKVYGKIERAFGANPSAEELGDECDTNAVSGVDIVVANRLVETSFTKKSYKNYIAAYMKKILSKLPEDQHASFKSSAQKAVQFILSKFDDWQFFQGESMDPDGMVAFLEYVDDGGTSKPYMLFFKDGLKEERL